MKTIRAPTLLCLLFCSLISISKHNHLHFSSYNFIIVAKPSFVTLFLMFHFIIITIFIGRPKPSVEEYSFSSLPPTSVHEMDKTIQEVEVCDSTSPDYEDDDQSYSTSNGYDDSYHGSDGYDEDNNDDVNDTEGEDSEDEEYDNELEKKIEEFIAKVLQERREEFQRDRFLCITAG